ncbi:hypothetical protein BWR59_28225 [Pseudomonas sp. Bc-h]|nr:hypothetical protein BWR59_28225 [Pseudomonas sp. Bc-h]
MGGQPSTSIQGECMADSQPDTHGLPEGIDIKRVLRRRKVMVCLGLLLAIVVVCVAAIVLMLQRLEARNASFQPPMTELERQRLLPQDPVLQAAPMIDGLRYGNQLDLKAGDITTPEDLQHVGHVPLSEAVMLQGNDLRADALQTGQRP